MEEAFKESRERVRQHRSRALTKQRERIKKEKRKEFAILLTFGIGLILVIYLSAKMGQDFTNDCIEAGYSKEYCISKS